MSDETQVQSMDPNQQNSTVSGPVDEEATVMLDMAQKTCIWNGQSFSEGAIVNDGSAAYECNYGQWVKKT